MLPNVDHPEAFGQHPNADIASQIIETRSLYTLTCCSSLFVPSRNALHQKRRERRVAWRDKRGCVTRQLLQWLTSKLKDILLNRRCFFLVFRRTRSGRWERDTRATAGKVRLLRASLENAKNSAFSTGYWKINQRTTPNTKVTAI